MESHFFPLETRGAGFFGSLQVGREPSLHGLRVIYSVVARCSWHHRSSGGISVEPPYSSMHNMCNVSICCCLPLMSPCYWVLQEKTCISFISLIPLEVLLWPDPRPPTSHVRHWKFSAKLGKCSIRDWSRSSSTWWCIEFPPRICIAF